MFICDILELWNRTPPCSGRPTHCSCWIWFSAQSLIQTVRVQMLSLAEMKPHCLYFSSMKSKPKPCSQPENITGPCLSEELQISEHEKNKMIKVGAIFFALILLFWYTVILARAGVQPPCYHPTPEHASSMALPLLCMLSLGCAYMEWCDLAKNADAHSMDSEYWHDNPVHPHACGSRIPLYYTGETAHWLRKRHGEITAKFLSSLEWTIIIVLSRKVAQLTEIHAWGITVVKNTLLLMTFYMNFYAEGILNILNARLWEHCR